MAGDPNKDNPIQYVSTNKGTTYGNADGSTHQTTGGHRSTEGPKSKSKKCTNCGKKIGKSMTRCKECSGKKTDQGQQQEAQRQQQR